MTKLYLLIKNNLLGFSGINKIKYAKSGKERRSAQFNFILFGAVAVLFCNYIYLFAKSAMKVFIMLNKPEYLLVLAMLICSSYILIVNIFKGPQTIFKFKDYDLLLSLPVTKRVIIVSKLIALYLYNILFQIIILLPPLIVYIKNVKVDSTFYFMYVVCFLIIPILPIVVATLLGTIVNYLASKLKFKNMSTVLFSIILMAIILVVNYKLGATKLNDLVIGQINIIDKIKYPYPLIFFYQKCITEASYLYLLLMIVITTIGSGLFLVIISRYHSKINQSLSGEHKNLKTNYKVNPKSRFKALFIKEIKRYFASPVYVLNTIVGLVMLLLLLGALIYFGLDQVSAYLKIPNINNIIEKSLPFVITLFCTMSCTTHCSVSLEGKTFWIMRSLPVAINQIMTAKIMLNLFFCIPVILISATILNFMFELTLAIRILLYITPIIAVILSSYLGLLLDLVFLKLDWDNEVYVVKQRIPALIAVFSGMLLAIIPMAIKYAIKNWYYITAITIIYTILALIFIYLVKRISEQKLNHLN
ncbi:MAG TPA: hypothetical protein PK737_00835 [Bacilli bacterium]|nr:hypothetical protein [Bacilli bacterium]